jgi:hypothetical protein
MMISASLGDCHMAALAYCRTERSARRAVFRKARWVRASSIRHAGPATSLRTLRTRGPCDCLPKPDSIPPVVNTRKAACDKRGLPADTSNLISSACSAPIRAPMRSPCSSAGRPARRAKPIQPARRQVGVQSTFVAHHRDGCPHDAESHDPDSELGSELMVLNAMVA